MVKFLRANRHTNTGQATFKTEGGDTVIEAKTVTVSSATLIDRGHVSRAVESRDWQGEVWSHYDNVGELHYAARWVASAVSRCILHIGLAGDNGTEPIPVHDDADGDGLPENAEDQAAQLAEAILDDLYQGQIGQGEMLRRMALHLSLVGETYLIGLDSPGEDEGRRWYVASNDELSVNSRGATLILPDSGKPMKLSPEDSTIIRIWNPHPRSGFDPDSAIRATIPALREIRGLSDHIAASVDSRLAGAGILRIPSEATVADPSRSDPGMTQPLHDDPLVATLMSHMITPIKDRDDASAVVPMVLKMSKDAGPIEHITLSTPLSEHASALRTSALERFASGADLPREIVTGTGSANHWSAWQLEEASVKIHIQPLAAVLCGALTEEYLWPRMRAAGIEDPTGYVIWYNSSELTQRPNKSSEAQALWDKGVLSNEALLRENGFGNSDKPTEEEHSAWLAERLALANPSLVPQLAPLLSGDQITQATLTALPSPPDAGGPPALDSSPDSTAPAPPGGTSGVVAASARAAQEHGWWLRAVEQVALRALELAGKRLMGWASRSERHWQSPSRQVLPWDMYTVLRDVALRRDDEGALDALLDGAYDSAIPNFGEDPCVIDTVDQYCRHLLLTGQPHRREYLATWLTNRGCTPALAGRD